MLLFQFSIPLRMLYEPISNSLLFGAAVSPYSVIPCGEVGT